RETPAPPLPFKGVARLSAGGDAGMRRREAGSILNRLLAIRVPFFHRVLRSGLTRNRAIFFQQVMRFDADALGILAYASAHEIGARQFVEFPVFKGHQISDFNAGFIPNILYAKTQRFSRFLQPETDLERHPAHLPWIEPPQQIARLFPV